VPGQQWPKSKTRGGKAIAGRLEHWQSGIQAALTMVNGRGLSWSFGFS
jgi:hypothetical protein